MGDVGAGELLEVRRAVGVLARCVGDAAAAGSRAAWAGVVAECQGVVNTLTAVQDVAIMRIAAVEEEWGEDGEVVESRRAPGHVALDAPDVIAGALRVSHLHAQRRVVLAARLAADGEGSAAPSGMGGVHAAMLAGRLDGYSARLLGEELEEAPAEVAAAVVRAIEEFFDDENAPQLRRKCRRALAKISPDLLRQRAQRARQECGLRRWADEPGVDRWQGSFPSEQAAT